MTQPAPTSIQAYYSRARDRYFYSATAVFWNVLPFACLELARRGWLPYWFVAALTFWAMTHWMQAIHELFHVQHEQRIDWFNRFMPMVMTPLSLGFKQYQAIHFTHHTDVCSPRDMEYYQLRGSKLNGFLNALTSPDQALFRWLQRYWNDPHKAQYIEADLVSNLLVNSTLFLLCFVHFGANFLWYWIPARLSYGINAFAFFYMLHRRGEAFGSYPVFLRRRGDWLYRALYGRDIVNGTCNHDIHHWNPRIAVRFLDLPPVRRIYDEATR